MTPSGYRLDHVALGQGRLDVVEIETRVRQGGQSGPQALP